MIEEFSFGMFRIAGKTYYDDIKIINNKVKSWQNRRGLEITLDNIKELVDSQPEILIIGSGASGLLKVPDEVKMNIMSHRIKLIVQKTTEAVATFNNAVKEGRKVAAIMKATG